MKQTPVASRASRWSVLALLALLPVGAAACDREECDDPSERSVSDSGSRSPGSGEEHEETCPAGGGADGGTGADAANAAPRM